MLGPCFRLFKKIRGQDWITKILTVDLDSPHRGLSNNGLELPFRVRVADLKSSCSQLPRLNRGSFGLGFLALTDQWAATSLRRTCLCYGYDYGMILDPGGEFNKLLLHIGVCTFTVLLIKKRVCMYN